MKYTSFLGMVAAIVIVCSCSHKVTVDELRKQKREQDSIALQQYIHSVAYNDSLLQVLQVQVNELLPQFKYEKSDKYEDNGRYVHRLLRTDLNAERCFLQVYVTDARRLILKSHYKGTCPIHTHAIEIHTDSIEQAFRGSTHAFEAEGYYEITTIDESDAVTMLQLIDAYSAERILVKLSGPKSSYRFYLSDRDKQALIQTYQLAVLMRDIYILEQQSKQASQQVLKYQKRLDKSPRS